MNSASGQANESKLMRWTAFGLVVVYAAIFILLSVLYYVAFIKMVNQGGGFVRGFETVQFSRIIASLAPYVFLPVAFVVAIIFYRKTKYSISIVLPLVLLAVVFGAGRTYLQLRPDSIQYHFGPRASPVPGFLVLAANSLPPGFKEVRHHYSLHEYTIAFSKAGGNGSEYLSISESDSARIVEPTGREPEATFTYQSQAGRVFSSENKSDKTKIVHSLFWYNGPQQRLYLSISAPKVADYTADDLIRILKSMQVAR